MHRKRWKLSLAAVAGAGALAVAFPASALDGPPQALPENASQQEKDFQPVYDYDKDGCYATPGIGADGTVAEGLDLGGDVNGQCRDESDLGNVNTYSREKCNNGWCGIVYASYFEKDQSASGPVSGGHTHDWEHVVVWVKDGRAEYVATSAHGGFTVHEPDALPWEGTHPKVVYHKDGASTHAFRAAKNDGGDEPPENHLGAWQRPALVGWEGYPEGLRDRLTGADFGDATLGIRDDTFTGHLEKALPEGVPFDPAG